MNRYNDARSLSDQLTELCLSKAVLKKDIAAAMGIEPSYLAQMLARGMDARRIELMTKAFNSLVKKAGDKIQPYFFDAYVIGTMDEHLKRDLRMIEVLRRVRFEMSESQREMWFRMSEGPKSGGKRG
jgi:protein involved in polysaccharide export with SLBB domain